MDSIDRPLSPDGELQMALQLEKSYTLHCMVKEYIEGYEPFDDRMGIWFLEYGLGIIAKVTRAGQEMWDALDCEQELVAYHTYLVDKRTQTPVPGWASARVIRDGQKYMDKPDWAEDMLAVLERYESGKWVA